MRVIDFYRFPIVIDWLVSITIDYVQFLSSIENIDLLRPDYNNYVSHEVSQL